jgi:hypothetical protein
MAIHPLLERELGPLILRLSKCNGVWHGELVEDGDVIWTSRGGDDRGPVEKAARDFADYQSVEVVDLG